MASKKYIEARDNLLKAIDIAIEAISRYPNGRDKWEYLNLIFAFLFCMALQCCDSKSNNHFTPSPMLSQLVAEFNNYLPLSVGQIGQISFIF